VVGALVGMATQRARLALVVDRLPLVVALALCTLPLAADPLRVAAWVRERGTDPDRRAGAARRAAARALATDPYRRLRARSMAGRLEAVRRCDARASAARTWRGSIG
jgi:hypothetical protein